MFNLLPLQDLQFFEDIYLLAHLSILLTELYVDCSSIKLTIPKKSILYFLEIPAAFNLTFISSFNPYKIISRAYSLISLIRKFKEKLNFLLKISS